MDNVTLADWAAWYDSNRRPNGQHAQKCNTVDADGLPLEICDEDNTEDDEINPNGSPSSSETPNKKQKCIERRSKARIIRSVWFCKESDPEKHYRELLMLFSAWRNESTDLLEGCETYMERCQMLREQINYQIRQYAAYSEQLEEVVNDVQSIEMNDDMWDTVAPNTQHRECTDFDETPIRLTGSTEVSDNYDLAVDLAFLPV